MRNEDRRKPRSIDTSSDHPGVWLVTRKRKGGHVYLARWLEYFHDEHGKVQTRRREESLSHRKATDEDPSLLTVEGRTRWMVRKSKEIGRFEAVHGRAVERPTLAEKRDEYLAGRKGELADRTFVQYKRALDELVKWAADVGVTHCHELRPHHLQQLRAFIINRPKWVPKQNDVKVIATKGRRKRRMVERVGQGKYRASMERLSPAAVNQRMKDVKAFLGELLTGRYIDPTVILERDLDKTLKAVKTPKPTIDALLTPQIRQLVEAVRRHDAEIQDGGPRYHGFADFVHLLLLGGLRLSEARTLEWGDVDVPGRQLTLRPSNVKTRAGRVVDLAITPSLVAMLERRRLQAGQMRYVFGVPPEKGDADYPEGSPLSEPLCKSTLERLIGQYGSGKFGWHQLRKTCASFLSCSDVYEGDAALKAAARHGHDISIAYRRYAKVFTNLPRGCRTLEQAMGVADLYPVSGARDARQA